MDVSILWDSRDVNPSQWSERLIPLIEETIEELQIAARKPGERFSITQVDAYTSGDVCTILSSDHRAQPVDQSMETDKFSVPKAKFEKFVLHTNPIMFNNIRIVLQLKSGLGCKTMYGNICIVD